MTDDPLSVTFAALSDPTRRAILARLAEGEASVNELARPFAMTARAVSKHLRALVLTERASVIGNGKATRYLGIADHGDGPSSVNGHARSDLFVPTGA